VPRMTPSHDRRVEQMLNLKSVGFNRLFAMFKGK